MRACRLGSAGALLVSFAVVVGCSSSSSSTSSPTDAAVDVADASADAVLEVASDVAVDVASDGGAACTFNRDCPAEQRCACTEAAGCFCEVGPRGTGKSGIDTCKTGNDCASSLCVEGPSSVYYCSGECTGPSDCTGALPKCVDVALIGKICARA